MHTHTHTHSQIYDHYLEFLSSMNLFAMVFCTLLTFKGLYFPSTKDSGTNGMVWCVV